MVNDEILGGIEAAILRGQSLHQAMLSFYNAGYSKHEIEEAAKQIQRTFSFPGKNPNLNNPKIGGSRENYKKSLDLKQGVSANAPKKNELQVISTRQTGNIPNKKPSKKIMRTAKSGKTNQIVSSYGNNTTDSINALKEAIEKLGKLKFLPGKGSSGIGPAPKAPIIVQKVSGYGSQGPKPISKAITFLLIFILVLLLGLLAVVFFFKDELVELFNNLSIV